MVDKRKQTTAKDVSASRYLTLRETQNASLELLKEFDALCAENNLRYDLAGGTLLGAVRHQGFIPWDDDVDVSMPRPDYERLLQLQVEGKLVLPSNRTLVSLRDGSFLRHYAKYCRIDLIRDSTYQSDEDSPFLGIDVFPHDGIPSDMNEFKRQVKEIRKTRKLLLLSVSRPHVSSQGKAAAIAKDVIRPFLKLYGSKRLAKKLDSICQQVDFETAEYTAGITGMYGLAERWRKEEWLPQTRLRFEDTEFPTYENFDIYLSHIYGDYMKLPPESKRPVPTDKFYRV